MRVVDVLILSVITYGTTVVYRFTIVDEGKFFCKEKKIIEELKKKYKL